MLIICLSEIAAVKCHIFIFAAVNYRPQKMITDHHLQVDSGITCD